MSKYGIEVHYRLFARFMGRPPLGLRQRDMVLRNAARDWMGGWMGRGRRDARPGQAAPGDGGRLCRLRLIERWAQWAFVSASVAVIIGPCPSLMKPAMRSVQGMPLGFAAS